MRKFLFPAVAVAALVSGVMVFQSQNKDFTTLDGQSYRWQEWQGKWIVVNYFAEWCVPCLREIPELNDFSRSQGEDGAKLFAVSYDELKTSHLKKIAEKYDMQFDLIRTDPERVMLNPKPGVLPTTFVISPEGEVVKTLLGEQTAESLSAEINRLKLL